MRRQRAKVRLGEIADRQWGRVTWVQIMGLGLNRWTANHWKREGYIHLVLPRVYAVGHRAPSYEAMSTRSKRSSAEADREAPGSDTR